MPFINRLLLSDSVGRRDQAHLMASQSLLMTRLRAQEGTLVGQQVIFVIDSSL